MTTPDPAAQGAHRCRAARWRSPLAGALIAALILLSVHFFRHVHQRMDEIDEGAVVFSTAYFDLLLEGKLLDPAWKALDALDHPPAWKYAHGAAMFLAGRPRGTLANKHLWLDWAWEDEPRFQKWLDEEVTVADLVPGRWLSFLSVSAALVLLGCLVARATNPITGGLVALLVAVHAVTKWVSIHALIDGLLLFAIAGSVALTARWLERGPALGRVAPGAALALGSSLGILANTKITGVVGAFGATLALGLWLAARPPKERPLAPALKSLAVVAIVTLAVAIGINPSLWSEPIAFPLAMLRHRTEQLHLQMVLFDARLHVPFSEGLRRLLFRALLWPDPVHRAIGVPVLAFAVFLGGLRLFRLERGSGAPKLALIAQLTTWGVATLLSYRMDWPRYTLPLIPLLALLTVTGVLDLVRKRGRISFKAAAPALVFAAGVATFAGVVRPPSDAQRKSDLRAGAAVIEEALSKTAEGSHRRRALRRVREVIAAELESEGVLLP